MNYKVPKDSGKEKVVGFRFSNRTMNNLNALVEMGLARNRTEAIDFALEHIVTEEKTKLLFQKKTDVNAQTPTVTETNPLLSIFSPFTRS